MVAWSKSEWHTGGPRSMALDVSRFHRWAVTDSCSVWNVLSSRVLHRTAIGAGCCFSLTNFTLYECLNKPRKKVHEDDLELQRRLRLAREEGQFMSYPLEVEDLQAIQILGRRQQLSKGELASIAFAQK